MDSVTKIDVQVQEEQQMLVLSFRMNPKFLIWLEKNLLDHLGQAVFMELVVHF